MYNMLVTIETVESAYLAKKTIDSAYLIQKRQYKVHIEISRKYILVIIEAAESTDLVHRKQ